MVSKYCFTLSKALTETEITIWDINPHNSKRSYAGSIIFKNRDSNPQTSLKNCYIKVRWNPYENLNKKLHYILLKASTEIGKQPDVEAANYIKLYLSSILKWDYREV